MVGIGDQTISRSSSPPAAATNNSWGQSYAYDGFGNLTDQNVTAGSAPAYHVVSNPATNVVGSADANGNNTGYMAGGYPSYDVENRLASIGYQNIQYSYAPGNKRVWRGLWSSGTLTTDEVTFWSVSGQKLATYQLSVIGGVINDSSSAPQLVATQGATNYYFGRKLIKNASGYVGADRLGSIGHYYPYGQEKPSATTNGTEKFTGYFRDAETGLDYADQRFHNPGTGRFLSPDPYTASSGAADPGSWNRYAYVEGDPINYWDPTGEAQAAPGAGGPAYCPSWNPACPILGGSVGGIGGGSVGGGVCPAGQYFNATSNNCADDGTSEDPAPPACPPQYLAFIKSYGANALATGLSEANVLALSAIESGFGGGRFAQGGNSFFNLETLAPNGWTPEDPFPKTIYVDQVSWMNAQEPIASGPNAGRYALVATYQNASDAFKSFAATDGRFFSGVTDPATFGKIAVAHGIYAGRGQGFLTTEKTFQDCLTAQKQ